MPSQKANPNGTHPTTHSGAPLSSPVKPSRRKASPKVPAGEILATSSPFTSAPLKEVLTEGDIHPEFFADSGLLSEGDPTELDNPEILAYDIESEPIPVVIPRERVSSTSDDSSNAAGSDQPEVRGTPTVASGLGTSVGSRSSSEHNEPNQQQQHSHKHLKKVAYFVGLTDKDPYAATRRATTATTVEGEIFLVSSPPDRNRKQASESIDEGYSSLSQRKKGFRIPIFAPFFRFGKAVSRNFWYCKRVLLPLLGSFLRNQLKGFAYAVHPRRLVPGLSVLRCLVSVIIDGTAHLFTYCFGCPRRPRVSSDDMNELTLQSKEDELESDYTTTDSKRVGNQRWHNCLHDKHEDRAMFDYEDPENYPNDRLIAESVLFDAGVGLSVGAMSIPQGMSYALLADLPPQYGLFNNMWFPLIYFFFGTSRHALTGVSAVENLMIGESISKIVGSDAPPEARVNCAFALALVSGCTFFVFRLLKLAVVADLLADPVLSGFSTGSAFIVGTSQVKYCLGLSDIKSEWGLPKTWVYILGHLNDVNLPPLVVAVVCLICLYICQMINKRWCKKFPLPGPLIVVIGACLVSYLVDLHDKYAIQIVGYIPPGLGAPTVPHIAFFGNSHPDPDPSLGNTPPPLCRDILVQAIKLCIVFYIIHISLSKSVAVQKAYQVSAPQELVAFGACDFVGGFFQCYPNCTSVSRTSVSSNLGAKTHLHGLFAVAVVFCVLLFLTVPLSYLPMAALGSIVIFGVGRMAEFHELRRLWRLQKASWTSTNSIGGGASSPDLLLWLVAFLCTCLFGASEGILISVCVSILWLLARIVRPPINQLGRIPETTIYRSTSRFPSSQVFKDIVVFRVDAPLCFCNATFLEQKVVGLLKDMSRIADPVDSPEARFLGWKLKNKSRHATYEKERRKVFILDCSSVNDLDVTAISALKRISLCAAKLNTTIAFANWKGPQRDFLHQANFYDIVPPRRCFLSIHDAVLWALNYQALENNRNLGTDPSRPRSRGSSQSSDGHTSAIEDHNTMFDDDVNEPSGGGTSPKLDRNISKASTERSICHVELPIVPRPQILSFIGDLDGSNPEGDPVGVPSATTPRAGEEVLMEVSYDGSTRVWGRNRVSSGSSPKFRVTKNINE